MGAGFAHGFHTLYWVLRSAMHLPDADQSRLVRAYREFLIIATGSRLMDRLEKWLNFVCPKSVILYAEKPETASARPAFAVELQKISLGSEISSAQWVNVGAIKPKRFPRCSNSNSNRPLARSCARRA